MSALTRRVVRFPPYTDPPLVATLAHRCASRPRAMLPSPVDRQNRIGVERSAGGRSYSVRDDRPPCCSSPCWPARSCRPQRPLMRPSCGPHRADQAVLKTQPREVTLEWSEPVDLGPGAVRLLNGTGGEVKTAAAKHGPGGPSTAVLPLPPGLAEGTYVVAWRVVSSDSHPVSGAFSFSSARRARSSSSRVARRARPSGRSTRSAVAWRSSGWRWRSVGPSWCSRCGPAGPARRARAAGSCGPGSALLLAGRSSCCSCRVRTRPAARSRTRSRRSRSASVRGSARARGADRAGVAFLLFARGLRVPAALCGVALIFTWTLVDHSRTGVQTWLGVPAATRTCSPWRSGSAGWCVVLACAGAAPVARFSRLAVVCWRWAVSGCISPSASRASSGAPADRVRAVAAREEPRWRAVILGLAWLSRRAVPRGGDAAAHGRGRDVPRHRVLGVTAVLVNTRRRAWRTRSNRQDRARPARQRSGQGRAGQAGRERRGRLSRAARRTLSRCPS